mgnify:CR=1 FL=1
METILLFVVCVVLFILLTPNLLMPIPKKYSTFFIFAHCFLFAALFISIRENFFYMLEGFDNDDPISLFNEKYNKNEFNSNEVKKYKSLYEKMHDNMSLLSEEDRVKRVDDEAEYNKLMEEYATSLSKEELEKFRKFCKKYDTYIQETTLESEKQIKKEYDEAKENGNEKLVEQYDKMDVFGVALSKLPVEKLQQIDEFPKGEQDALMGLIFNMSDEEIYKFVNLDTDKMKTMIRDASK